jgi:hypothetical protein
MYITPDRDTRPSSEANRGGSLRSGRSGQNRCILHKAGHIHIRYRSEGKTELATTESEFAYQITDVSGRTSSAMPRLDSRT